MSSIKSQRKKETIKIENLKSKNSIPRGFSQCGAISNKSKNNFRMTRRGQ